MISDKIYNHKKFEDKIYQKWEKSRSFVADNESKKKPFVISMPPPNATGTLHLGHATMLAIQDIMIRYKRMQGFEALWLPGTDHAAIATQNKVEQLLAKDGKDKYDLGRAKFLQEVREYVKGSRNTIRNQIRKMGSSCDWSRERYTLDDGLSNAVLTVFEKMYKDGLIYRGNRIVNWCPRCESVLADDEVEHKDLNGNFYHIKYKIKGEDGYVTIATTRPETMLGDTAVAVNPKDKRHKDLIGKTAILPILKREIPIIGDKYVDLEMGTGALKVTPSHDPNDFELGKKHKLQFINIMNDDGRLNKNAGEYAGQDRFEARKAIINKLKDLQLLEKTVCHMHSVGHCYRCDTIIEPLTSLQWFIDVDKKVIKDGKKKVSLKEKAIKVVKDGSINIIPKRFNKTYFHFLENLYDWCISRQIWWGHRIPVYYCKKCYDPDSTKDKGIIVSTEKPEKCPHCKGTSIKQDPDTLDTWFSSGLWTFSTLGWPENTKDMKKFHPTQMMETGYDILFFWIARMIIMTNYALNDIPFETVYLHGLIRDKEGRKMSKSLGNGIDPLDMIDQFGADALRLSLVIGSTPGNDLRIYEEKIQGYRNFINKIWNASRFILMNVSEKTIKDKSKLTKKDIKTLGDKWIMNELHDLTKEITNDLDKYMLSDAGTKVYNFIWGKLCDWYLEISKGDKKNEKLLLYVYKNILKLLHPFTPFVTEVLWNYVEPEKMLIKEDWPDINEIPYYKDEAKEMNVVIDSINTIRSLRNQVKVDPTKKIDIIFITKKYEGIIREKQEVIKKIARIENIIIKDKKIDCDNAVCGVSHGIQIIIPVENLFDVDKEKSRLKEEIKALENHIKQIKGKLSNKNFTEKAPKEIVDKEKSKLEQKSSDLEELKKRLNMLG